MSADSFLSSDDEELSRAFLADGYIIRQSESPETLEELRNTILTDANKWLTQHGNESQLVDLQTSHLSILSSAINDIRLYLFSQLNVSPQIRYQYFSLASQLLQRLVGNELAMQNKVNLSIQQPGDQTSVLELHSDVWSGDSPFQVVLWTPLTDTNGTNAMFLLSPTKSQEAYSRAREGELRSMADIHNAYQDQFQPIEVQFGDVLIFDSNCLHGNQLNTTASSRWSLNCRVANLLAPATTPERRLGSYYTPIMVRPATRMGLRAIDALGILE